MAFFDEIDGLLENPRPPILKLMKLLEPVSDEGLEALARESLRLTRLHFGKTMRLFAPIYLSNECINNCTYCGFSRDNPILRTTLTIQELTQEAKYLYDKGLRSVLLVAGEHPKFVSDGYLQECLHALRPMIPSLGLEIGPLPDNRYEEIVKCGAESLIVYQETYNKNIYKQLHTGGMKRNYEWRLNCPERAYAGGFRRIGIGALFGLAPWREEAIALATHADYLLRTCWKSQLTISFPRMRPYAGNYEYTPNEQLMLDDRSFVQLMCALRICFPQVGFVISTREPEFMRNALVNLGMTSMSACAKTEPGGYTGAGTERIHRTIKDRQVELDEAESSSCKATEQFSISDIRSPEQIAAMLTLQGIEPVWKDWDAGLQCHMPQ